MRHISFVSSLPHGPRGLLARFVSGVFISMDMSTFASYVATEAAGDRRFERYLSRYLYPVLDALAGELNGRLDLYPLGTWSRRRDNTVNDRDYDILVSDTAPRYMQIALNPAPEEQKPGSPEYPYRIYCITIFSYDTSEIFARHSYLYFHRCYPETILTDKYPLEDARRILDELYPHLLKVKDEILAKEEEDDDSPGMQQEASEPPDPYRTFPPSVEYTRAFLKALTDELNTDIFSNYAGRWIAGWHEPYIISDNAMEDAPDRIEIRLDTWRPERKIRLMIRCMDYGYRVDTPDITRYISGKPWKAEKDVKRVLEDPEVKQVMDLRLRY